MSNFDTVIEEIFGKVFDNIGTAFDAAKATYSTDIRTAPQFIKKTLQNTKELKKELPKKLEQEKTKLKFVTTDTANKVLQDLKTPQSTESGETSTANIFPPTAVIMEKVGNLEGLMGEIIDVNDPLVTSFANTLTQILNKDQNNQNNIDIKKLVSQNGTFWVRLTTPKATNESFDSVINYQYSILNEAVDPNPEYATWFIFESDSSTYQNKFKITKAQYQPGIELGKAFRLDDNRNRPTGVLQVGQGTLYPRWYLLNDFTEQKGPLGIKQPENYQDVKIS